MGATVRLFGWSDTLLHLGVKGKAQLKPVGPRSKPYPNVRENL